MGSLEILVSAEITVSPERFCLGERGVSVEIIFSLDFQLKCFRFK
jgi:hypothetical protein